MVISMEMVYEELKELRKDILVIRYALIPEEEVSGDELEDIMSIAEEMKKGVRVKLESALKEL
jgi:pyruvate-formate lyase-activating enzyme